jgi:hypothetical protein
MSWTSHLQGNDRALLSPIILVIGHTSILQYMFFPLCDPSCESAPPSYMFPADPRPSSVELLGLTTLYFAHP